MSRRVIVRRKDPTGSPIMSSSARKGESYQTSPRTTASPRGSAWQTTPRRNPYHVNHGSVLVDDPNISAIASPRPPPTPPTQPSLSFLEQLNQTPESEIAPDEGALQFVPAFEASGIPGASWGSEDDNDDLFLLRDEKKEEPARSVVSGTSTTLAQRALQWKKAQTARKEARSTIDTPNGKNNTRIARLASLFSSRAVVKGESTGMTTHQQQHQQPPKPQQQQPQQQSNNTTPNTSFHSQVTPQRRGPPSPAPSSGSSGYVGWPGTQDKGGRTVSLPSSYDDSSSITGPRASPVSGGRPTTPRRNRTEFKWSEPKTLAAAPSPKRSLSAMQYEAANSRQRKIDDLPQEPIFWQHFPEAKHEWNTPGDTPSSPSTVSKTSSAYFQPRDMRQLAYPDLEEQPPKNYGMNKDLTATILRTTPSVGREVFTPRRREVAVSPRNTVGAAPRATPEPQVPTEERMAVKNHLTPPHRPFAAAKGYPGLIQKTQEVPSLMDDVNDSDTSSRATTTVSQSDVFDGLSTSDVFDNLASPRRSIKERRYPERINEEEEEDFKLVDLGGGITVIQSSAFGFSNRQTASDYDDNLTNSDVDQRGFTRTPDLKEMLTAGTSADSALSGIRGNFGNRPSPVRHDEDPVRDESSSSSVFTDPYVNSVMNMGGDLAEYCIEPSEMKKVLRKFRELADRSHVDMSLAELEKAEDESKAFALFEMRSRIMEKDIERGLERRGGTVVVDDIVTTPYHRAAHRVRDAVIVAKAWRDGASPHDVINTSILTRRSERCYFIKRALPWQEPISRYSGYFSPRYYWEAVRWVDDTDFLLYRCPSLGPRNLRGFEMFTVGDCQSILLKLTNERCLELRAELNEATKQQIVAEEMMKAEGDEGDGMMTEAEMTYLTAMEEVKTISKKLVLAEQAFALVRDRVEKIVAKYQSLLLKIETAESFTASSIVTYTSSHYSDHDSAYWEEEEEREAALWARRARRAEIKAEVAAREALLARQEARMMREEKERELETLRQKLSELQSEASHAISERERLMANRAYPHQPIKPAGAEVAQNGAPGSQSLEKKKLDGVKQRFRDRMAARKQLTETGNGDVQNRQNNQNQPPLYQSHQRASHFDNHQASLVRTAGEEMYQHLDFYERSLKAIDQTRD